MMIIASQLKQQEKEIVCTTPLRWACVEMNHDVPVYVFLSPANFFLMPSFAWLMKRLKGPAAELTKIPENVLFPVALTANGDRAITNGGSRIDAVKAEAVATC